MGERHSSRARLRDRRPPARRFRSPEKMAGLMVGGDEGGADEGMGAAATLTGMTESGQPSVLMHGEAAQPFALPGSA
jgi:hypothetical protein